MKVSTLRSLAALAFTLVFSGLTAAQDRPALIGAVRGAEVVNPNPAAPISRTRLVTPDFSALGHVGGFLQTRPGVVRPMDIAFFDDRTITVNLNRVERLESGVSNFYGGVEGDEFGHAVITSSNDVMAATVFTGGKTYSIRSRPEGYVSREVNTTALSEHQFDMVHPESSAAAQADGPPAMSDTAAFIDVVVLYTTRTRTAVGGVANVEVEINNGIAVSNSAYSNTGVTQRVRLAYAGEINYTGDTSNVSIGTVIQALQPNTGAAPTGVFAGIPGIRTTYGGDILSLWIEGDGNGGQLNGGCGVGYFMNTASASFAPFAVNVLIRELCAVDNQSFPHEMGHNMGLAHDVFVDATGSTTKPYARGFVDTTHQFRTIMAYNNACANVVVNCTRINGFSSPLFTYTGFVVGVANVADSSRAMNENALIVANFKTSVVGPGTLQVKNPTQAVGEGVGTAQVAVSRVGGSVGAVSVNYTTANVTAIAGTDYTTAIGILNWADGDTADKFIPVPVTQNATIDGNRTFTATISTPAGGAALGATTTTVTINDDEAALTFALATSNVSEGAATNVNVAVNRVGSTAGAVSVTWITINGTATAGTDFGTNGNPAQKTGILSWAAGDGAAKNITVGLSTANIPVINDTNVEASKSFDIFLSTPTGGAAVGAISTNTVTIVDTDSTIQFFATTATVSEAGPNITVAVTRTGAATAAQAVTYTTTAGTATATTDYTTTTGSITFAIGETLKVITIGPTVVAAPFIRVMNDATIEGPETFNITLSAPTNGAALGTDKVMMVTINSDENGVSMATATRSFAEGAGAQQIFVNRAGSNGAVSVNYAFVNGTAQNGVHYTGAGGTLNWANGETGAKAIDVTIGDDAAPNANRTFTVQLSGATGATLAAPMSTANTITDNENTVQFTVTSATVAEGANLMLTVSRTGFATGQGASVTWTANNGTAALGTDFGGPGTGTLTWAAGVTTSQTISIPIINDLLVQGARTFSVSLSAPVGPNLSIGASSNVNVTLNDNDKGLQFEFPAYSVTEGTNPNVTIRVVRIGPATTAATATWATVNGSAESGKDFGIFNNLAPRTGTLSWAINDSTPKTITIPVINDTLGGEGDEAFTVTLTPGAGLVLGPNAVATVTIHDDDIPPETNVKFSQPKYVVMENGVNAVLTVQRVNIGGPPSVLAASVNYATVPGTALATSDYTTKTGTLNWVSGDFTDKQITIAIVNNAVAESPESFKVTLTGTNPGTGLATPNEATVLILDDDEVFPLDGAMPAGFATPVASTKGWQVSNDPGAYEGVYALKSDEIDDNETAGLEMDGTFAAGNVSFRVKVSTEPTFDTLQFFIDGVLQATWSGTANTAWQMSSSYPVTAGHHTLSWVYTKDGSAAVGMDAVYLDGLVTPTFTP